MIFQWKIALYSINRDGIQPSQYNTTTIQIVNELACFVSFQPFFSWGDFKSNGNGQVASFWLLEFRMVDQVHFWKS